MSIRILIVDDDPVLCNGLQTILSQQGYETIITKTAEEAIEYIRVRPPQLVISEVILPGMDGLAFSRELRQIPSTRFVPILILTWKGEVADKVAGFEAGADEYLVKPFDQRELVWRIKVLLTRTQQITIQSPEKQPTRGKIIAVFSPKSGVGKTAVAINLATALQKFPGNHVALMDADFSFGQVGVNLNISNPHNILHLARNIDDLDEDLIRDVLVHHESGIHLLLNPLNPEEADNITDVVVRRILSILPQMYSHIIVDCQSRYDETMLEILDLSDLIFLVITPQIGSLMVTSRFLGLMQRLNMHSDRIRLVVNRYNSKVGYETSDIERALKIKVKFCLVSAGREIAMSENRGIPLFIQSQNHPFSLGIKKIAESIVSESPTS